MMYLGYEKLTREMLEEYVHAEGVKILVSMESKSF